MDLRQRKMPESIKGVSQWTNPLLGLRSMRRKSKEESKTLTLPMTRDPDEDCSSCEGCEETGCELNYFATGLDLDDDEIEWADD